MDLIDLTLKWIVAPLAAFIVFMYSRQQDHHVLLAVIKSQIESNKESHDRENKEMRDNLKAIFTKLDSIETALRK